MGFEGLTMGFVILNDHGPTSSAALLFNDHWG